MKKEAVTTKLNVADGDFSLPFSVVLLEDRAIDEMVLLEITKPDNGAYLMKVKGVGIDKREGCSLETSDLTPDEFFEAWMVMGHTIRSLVSPYKKELIDYMVKEYRTREQLEKENEKTLS